ncbi:bifunctional uridylyltransferase/uridylyl-removing protein GlnD [Utexia brackfieldae]|uniref:bifunctional uridylyltransferase/uridylyl-removing protein GlnD n=1 Tax=Utexia brackfieldae TaxID=3074108 RepID=UPI00370D4382
MSKVISMPVLDLPFSPVSLTDAQINIVEMKKQLTDFTQWSLTQFKQKTPIDQLILLRSQYIDALLQRLWHFYQFANQTGRLFNRNRVVLIAVGGYGREELHPLSDIDLLFLTDKPLNQEQEDKIGQIVRFLWDLHLEVGHSVRTLKGCLQEAQKNLSVMTNLIESRIVIGHAGLFNDLRKQLFTDKIWPSPVFYQAKRDEQQQRHQQYHGTSYNLEPDIKNSPGGLRDIQTIQWIALRHFGGISMQEFNQFNYLTPEEMEKLKQCRQFLWRIRFALHSVITRYDNRLLFERQLSIAHLLGYEGEGNRPVERMMLDYYRVVHNTNELNQMLLQLFEESILALNPNNKPYDIDEFFQVRDGLIDIKDEQLFIRDSTMIMQLFHTLVCHPHLRGIYSNTIRQLRYARRKLKHLLCEDPKCRAHFMAIIQHPDAIEKALLPMHQYSILAAYIPGWKHIAGMMQFDLFHAYTVDEHTMRVLKEINQYLTEEGQRRHPNSSHVYQKLSKPYLLIIAALFHDIAKGMHGDHSELGASALQIFCQLHDFSERDTELVVWLVRDHLLMSVTAQGRDIQDPLVIREFAQRVNTKRRLQYLLCLTVADVCATNETLWNSWKQSLIRELYFSTERALELGFHQLPQHRAIVRQHKQAALKLLAEQNITQEQIKLLWERCHFDYFLRYSAEQIVWHTVNLCQHDLTQPLVLITPDPDHGGTELFIYSPDRPFLFAAVSNQIGHYNLNIHEALIITTRDGYALDTFIVLEPNGHILNPDRYTTLINGLEKTLAQKTFKRRRIRKMSAKLKNFHVPTQVNFLSAVGDRKTYVELIALDRPGLLAYVGEIFAKLQLSLRSAKIATIGEQVKDLFILTDKEGHALSDETCLQLRYSLVTAIDEMDSNNNTQDML